MKQNKGLVILAIAIVFGLALILVPVTSEVSPAQAAITWAKSSLNPVLDEGDLDDWDEGGVGGASVIWDDADSLYKMWYTGLTPDLPPVPAIGYATSTNGISWAKYGTTPVLTKGTSGAWDDEGVGSPSVIWDADDGVYKMWYTGTPARDASAVPAIGYVESADGITWTTNRQQVTGLVSAGVWDDAGVMSPSVIKDGTTYKMWYSGRSAGGVIGSLRIGYAESTDGKSWTNPQMVLDKGASGEWDERGVGVGCVIEISGEYNMWFTGYTGYEDQTGVESAIGYASSDDGIDWTKDSNPELTIGIVWEAKGVGAPWVTYANRVYRMWYSGLDTNLDPTLGYAQYSVPGGGGGGGGGGADKMPPIISNVLVSNITKTSADFSWATHERSDSQVEYRSSPTTLTPLDETMVREHLVPVTNLTPATAYYFKVRSTDGAGNLAASEEYTFTTPGKPATFTTSDLAIAPSEVDIGENVTISVSIANTGDVGGSYKVTLKIDNVVVTTKDITVAAGASQKVTFTTAKDVAGTYAVSINALSGTFMVKAAPPPVPPPPPPVPPPPKSINFWLIGGIVAACITIGVVITLLVIRRRA